MDITIHDVTQENVQAILNLRVGAAQQGFIESTQQCLDEAKECANYKPVGLYVDFMWIMSSSDFRCMAISKSEREMGVFGWTAF